MMLYGYARVSSKEQNLDRQLIELRKYVDEEKIVVDKSSGKDFDRPGYSALKGALGLRPGDTLYIVSLDRLSRNKTDIKNELIWFKEHDIQLKVLNLPTTMVQLDEGQRWIMDMVNNVLIEVLSTFAEQERIIIRKRQQEGIAAARKKGKHLGRPRISYPANWDSVYELWKKGQITAVEAMKRLGMKRSSFYAMARRYEQNVSKKV